MCRQKRIAAIHDISGVGKCSLTVALPILSAAGCEAAVIPTAVLSTHTGGFSGYTYRDLTDDMIPMAEHWKANDFKFDAVYSGFLGSTEQVAHVEKIIDTLSGDDTLVMIDPAMADRGVLYKTFAPDFPEHMKKLVAKADILTPNITEACLMTDTEYKEGPYKKEYIETLLKKCAALGSKKIVLTGVYFDDDYLGCAAYDCKSDDVQYILAHKEPGFYHGTGDIFASALLSGLMNGYSLERSAKLGADFVAECIKETEKFDDPIKYGVYFEKALPFLMKALGII